MKDRRAKRLIYCAYILNKIGLLDYSIGEKIFEKTGHHGVNMKKTDSWQESVNQLFTGDENHLFLFYLVYGCHDFLKGFNPRVRISFLNN